MMSSIQAILRMQGLALVCRLNKWSEFFFLHPFRITSRNLFLYLSLMALLYQGVQYSTRIELAK